MIINDFEEWVAENAEKHKALLDSDVFRFFYANKLCKDKSEHEILCQLGYELYCMQVCIEGIFGDMELMSEEMYEYRKQESKQPRLQELRGRLCRVERYGNSAV